MNRPSVTISYAQTLDGRIATLSRSSQWISGPEGLVFAHRLRAEHDAIMVGVGTVLQDDPRLTVRHVAGRDPLRVVVDSTLRTPLVAAVLASGAARGTVLACTARAPAERCGAVRELGALLLTLPESCAGQVDLVALLHALQAQGVRSIMVEGGAGLLTSLLRARLVDRVAVTVAPKVLGAGVEAVGDLGIRVLADAFMLDELRVERLGADVLFDGRVRYPS